MKQTNKTKAMLFIICKINMIAATIISSRSVSTGLKAIRTLVLVIMFAAGVVANIDAASKNLRVVAQFTNSAFGATAAIADTDIWAVGDSTSTNQTLAVRFDGRSWSVVPTPTLAASSLAGVSAVASNDVWAVGGQTVSGTANTLIEHWNGTTWSVVTSPTPVGGGSLAAVAALSSTDVWAVGTQSQ